MIWPFYVCAALAIISTIRVITNTNPVHALLALISSLLSVAGIFFCIGASFAAALEIIVYAGAILVLFVFVVMMLNLGSNVTQQEKIWLDSKAWAFPVMVSVFLMLSLGTMLGASDTGRMAGQTAVNAKQVGISLFGTYLLMVELASMVLLGALVAAYHLGKKTISEDSNQDGARSS